MTSAIPLAEPITVCLTTIHARLGTLHQTLETLARQDYPNFTVRLYVSREPYLLDQGVSHLPNACLQTIDNWAPRIEVHYVENIGSYRKLVPFLAENVGRHALVVTADDDTLYPDNWLSTLYRLYIRHRCIICFRGHRMVHAEGSWQPYRHWMGRPPEVRRSTLNLPTGKDGVLYNSLFFNRDVLDMKSAMAHAKSADDLWFKWHSTFAHIPAFVIHADYRSSSFPVATSASSLYESYNVEGANDTAVADLEKLFVARYGRTLLASLPYSS